MLCVIINHHSNPIERECNKITDHQNPSCGPSEWGLADHLSNFDLRHFHNFLLADEMLKVSGGYAEVSEVMEVLPNHPKLDFFSIETHGFGGTRIVGNSHMCHSVPESFWYMIMGIWNLDCQYAALVPDFYILFPHCSRPTWSPVVTLELGLLSLRMRKLPKWVIQNIDPKTRSLPISTHPPIDQSIWQSPCSLQRSNFRPMPPSIMRWYTSPGQPLRSLGDTHIQHN